MAREQRDRAKEQHWRRHLAAWRRSGWTIRAYCQAEGLSEPSFYAWRRVLTGRRPRRATTESSQDNTAKEKAASSATVSAFVPVRLVGTPASAAAVEVVLRGGRVVRVAAGFAAQTLRDVVAVLEGLPC